MTSKVHIKSALFIAICAMILALLCPAVVAVETVDILDTWTAPGLNEWQGSGDAEMSNPGGFMEVAFPIQGFPEAEMTIVSKHIPKGTIITNLSLSVTSVKVKPSAVRLYLVSESGKSWQLNLDPPLAGATKRYNLPVNYEAGWSIGAASTEAQFDSDMQTIKKIGAYILRGGTCAAQDYRIDNVRVQGRSLLDPLRDTDGDGLPDLWEIKHGLDPNDPSDAALDLDADGASNSDEFLAGTKPNRSDAVYTGSAGTVSEIATEVVGVLLKWDSVAERTYSIWRSTDPAEGFNELYTGIPATPPMNEYEDNTATNDVPYYYSIRAE